MDCDVVDFEPYLDVFLTGTSSLIGTIKKVKFDDLDIRRTQFIAAIKRFLGEGTYIVVFLECMFACIYMMHDISAECMYISMHIYNICVYVCLYIYILCML